MSAAEPIWIPCEGSGCVGHDVGADGGLMCQMCGEVVVALPDFLVADHERQDILAMLKRGDFG